MKVDIAGGAYQTFSKNINAQECVNFYTHIDQEGGSSQMSLRGTPGLKTWCDTSLYGEVRGLHNMNDKLFAVVGNTVYRINHNGDATAASTKLDTSSGPVSMDSNTTQVMIVDGEQGYIVTDSAGTPTLTQITDPGMGELPTTVTYQDGYFLVSINGSGRVYISDSLDGTSWDSTMYFNAEGYPDNTLAVLSDHRDLIAFGTNTMETYYNSGATVPFTRKPGYTQEKGIGARHSVIQLENTVYLLTNDFQIAKLQGARPVIVSPRSIDYQIAQDSDRSNAIGIGITIEGNAFYILTTQNNTWVYNAATGLCHKLSSYPEPFTGRWRGNCATFFNNHWVVGDYENGKIYQLDYDTFTDNGEIIRRKRITPGIRKEGKDLFHHSLEVFFEAGVGLDGGVQGSDPIAMLRYSDDGGHTWSYELWRSVGKIGVYKQRAMWNRLGASRHRHYEITVSDPVKWVILDASLEAEIGIT